VNNYEGHSRSWKITLFCRLLLVVMTFSLRRPLTFRCPLVSLRQFKNKAAIVVVISLPVPPPGELDENARCRYSCTFTSLCENVTSSTKPVVHDVLHCCQRRNEPRPQVKWTENFAKFGHVVLYLRADRQTDRRTDTCRCDNRNTSPTYRRQSNKPRLFSDSYVNIYLWANNAP